MVLLHVSGVARILFHGGSGRGLGVGSLTVSSRSKLTDAVLHGPVGRFGPPKPPLLAYAIVAHNSIFAIVVEKGCYDTLLCSKQWFCSFL